MNLLRLCPLLLAAPAFAGDYEIMVIGSVTQVLPSSPIDNLFVGDELTFRCTLESTGGSNGFLCVGHQSFMIDPGSIVVTFGDTTVTSNVPELLQIYDGDICGFGGAFSSADILPGHSVAWSASLFSAWNLDPTDLASVAGTYTTPGFFLPQFGVQTSTFPSSYTIQGEVTEFTIRPLPFVVGCGGAQAHHAGQVAKLDGSSVGVHQSGLHLEVTDGPVGQFGFFLVSRGGANSTPLANGGILCLDAPLGRYSPQTASTQGLPQLNSLGQFDASGVLQSLTGTSSVSSGFDVPTELPFWPTGQSITPGDTLFFQAAYRDLDANSSPTMNLSNMLSMTF